MESLESQKPHRTAKTAGIGTAGTAGIAGITGTELLEYHGTAWNCIHFECEYSKYSQVLMVPVLLYVVFAIFAV